jgi:predicted nucleic acid-binding protein
MATIYLETTIPSYLASRPSRDLVVAAHQQITHDWWAQAKNRFELFVSEAVLEEIRAGDPEAAARRMDTVRGLPVLALTEKVRRLVRVYSARLGLPPHAGADVVHIALAVTYELDYLVTWNCKHIANGQIVYRLIEINRELGKRTPLILTPEELP